MTIIAGPDVVVLDGEKHPVHRIYGRPPTAGKRWHFRAARTGTTLTIGLRVLHIGPNELYGSLQKHAFEGSMPVVIEAVHTPTGFWAEWRQEGKTITVRRLT